MNQINNVASYGCSLPAREDSLSSRHLRSAKNQQQKPRSGTLASGRARVIAEVLGSSDRTRAIMGTAKSGESLDVETIDIVRAVDLWGDTVLRLALCKTKNRFDAEDIVQTVFMKLCQSKPSFASDEHQKAWLLKVALRCSIDKQRDPWEQRRTDSETATRAIEQMSVARDNMPFCDSKASQRKTLVEQAVASLPEKQRIAVHLHYFECYSTQEIAHIMGEKASTLRSHLRRARMALKTTIGGTNE